MIGFPASRTSSATINDGARRITAVYPYVQVELERMMQSLLMTSVLGYVLTAMGASAPQSDKETFQGTWPVVSMQIDGRDEYDAIVGMKWTFSGDKLTGTGKLDGEEKSTTGTFTFDPSKEPKTIDLRFGDKINYKGIYRFGKGRLTICYNAKDRPTEFSSGKGSNNVLLEFEQ
jgi:uncharacterized protein (TIGR03067 family)